VARIVSFEPLAGPAALYRAVFAGDDRARLVAAATILTRGAGAGGGDPSPVRAGHSSSLLPITARQSGLFPGTAETGTAIIQVTRLSDVLPAGEIAAPALLKLDVQGFELPALAGCEGVLERFAWVYVECSFMELYAGQFLPTR
jgi:FkbM family methyltransferase